MIRSYSILLLLFFLAFAGNKLFAQDEKVLQQYEDSLKELEPKIFLSKTDKEKYEANKKYIELLEQVLGKTGSFEFPFDSLKGIARLTSPDKRFRIFNWNLPLNDGTFEYFGFVQVYSKKEKAHKLFRLTDKSGEIKNADNAVGSNEKWFGMLYYKIIATRYKKHTYYTLLGWDGNDNMSRKKIIDVISFGSDGTPKFGDGIFIYEKKFPRRVIFEYAADATMSLNYDESSKTIVFAHLVPSHPALEGQYQFYVTDGSYNGFVFKKGKWEYVKDVDARNPKSNKDRLYKAPENMTPPPKK